MASESSGRFGGQVCLVAASILVPGSISSRRGSAGEKMKELCL